MAKLEANGEKLYSIGEVSKLCNVSKKALRFYDEIGIISPDKVSPSNHYRYYSRKSLLDLTIVKYYKQMGFKLEEMRGLLNSEEYDLLVEAQTVIENDVREVSVKFIEPQEYGFMDQDFIEDDREAVINLEWTDYLNSIKNEITGPVNITFPSWRDRLDGTCQKMRIMQKLVFPSKPEHQIQMGGEMMLSCYHIGSHDTLRETYEKIEQYAANHGYKYKLAEDSWERYVTDCWTTNNSDMYVTEVRIGASR